MLTETLLTYRFTAQHEWIAPAPTGNHVGISNFAQGELGDIVFVELPRVGNKFRQDETYGTMEAVKAVTDLSCPAAGEVVAVNQRIDLEPSVVNIDPYGEGWLISLRLENPSQLDSLYNLAQYRAEVLEEVEHILYLDEMNQIHYVMAVRGEDGRVIVNTRDFQSIITQPLIPYTAASTQSVVDEFEYLLNKKSLKEAEMQRFFEQHPEFLLGTEYERIHSQVVLRNQDGDELRPDFILKPLAGVSYQPQIVELKLPGQSIIKQTPRREGLYAKIYEAAAQLRAYARYFEEQQNREYVQSLLGFTAYKPKLTLVIGRTVQIGDEKLQAAILNSVQPIELLTYQDLLLKYKKLASR